MKNSEPDSKETATDRFVGFDAGQLSSVEAYRLLNHCVAPRPIAFVSTLSSDGQPNLAPFSYFMAGGANPPSIAFSPTPSRSGIKDTLRNIQATGEYVVNIVTYAMRERMNATAAALPHGVSEWDEAGFASLPSAKVKPARVADSPLAMECRLHRIVAHGEGPSSAHYVIGEIVWFHVARSLLTPDGNIDATQIGYIARMGGDWYDHVTSETMFELSRPM